MKGPPPSTVRLLVGERRKKGSALIVVLWAVTLLAFAVAISGERVALMLGDSSLRARRLQARLLAESAMVSRVGIFKEEQRRLLESTLPGEAAPRRLDLAHMIGSWRSQPVAFGEGWFWIEVRDEQARIHWRKTSPAVWRNLLELCGMPPERIEVWFDAMADWEDPGDVRRLNGAESADYLALEQDRRRAKNLPITDLGEIPWIAGAPEILDLRVPVDAAGRRARLAEITTLWGDGKINLNTAPPILVAAALGLDLEEAVHLVRARAGPDGIEGTADDVPMENIPRTAGAAKHSGLGELPGNRGPVAGSTTTSSKVFRLRGVGWFQGQQVTCEALVRSAGGDAFELIEEPRVVEARSVVGSPTVGRR
ncbi:MAG: general secretion pathway protein GspK [Verrucomicrobiia bacterium]